MKKTECLAARRIFSSFTLVELLISISIFALIILSLYSAFQTGFLSYNRIDSAFNIYQTARLILNRIDLDLKNAFIYSRDDSRFRGNAGALEFFSIADSFQKGETFSYFCRIRYESNNQILNRVFYQNLEAVKEDSVLEGEELSPDVKEISFQYAYKSPDPSKPFDWQDSWPKEGDTNQKKDLPLAVKIKLSLIEKNKQQEHIVEFSRTVALPLTEQNAASASGPGAPGE